MVNAKYTPTEDKLKEEELQFGYWFVTHQLLLRRLGILTLFLINGLMLLYVLWGIADYYILSQPKVQAMYQSLTSTNLDYQYLAELGQPQPLVVERTRVLTQPENKYDFVAEVKNINKLWHVSAIVYHFESGEVSTPSTKDYLLPGQVKYLMTQAQPSDTALANANLVIEKIQWEKTYDYDKLSEKILVFEVLDPQFIPPRLSGITDAVLVSRVLFKIKNNSAYNFANLNAKVVLLRGDTIVGINNIPITRFDSGETRSFEYLIYGQSPQPTQVVVLPDVNILNPDSFKAFDGEGQYK